MTWVLGAAIYFITWWIVLFAVLPIGVRTQWDENSVEPGTADSAPTAPRLLFRIGLTTLIATVIFCIIWAMMTFVRLDDIPFLPRFEPN